MSATREKFTGVGDAEWMSDGCFSLTIMCSTLCGNYDSFFSNFSLLLKYFVNCISGNYDFSISK